MRPENKMTEQNPNEIYCDECVYYRYTAGDMGGWEDCLKEKVLEKYSSPIHRPKLEWARPYIKNKNRDCPDFKKKVRNTKKKSFWDMLCSTFGEG